MYMYMYLHIKSLKIYTKIINIGNLNELHAHVHVCVLIMLTAAISSLRALSHVTEDILHGTTVR